MQIYLESLKGSIKRVPRTNESLVRSVDAKPNVFPGVSNESWKLRVVSSPITTTHE